MLIVLILILVALVGAGIKLADWQFFGSWALLFAWNFAFLSMSGFTLAVAIS